MMNQHALRKSHPVNSQAPVLELKAVSRYWGKRAAISNLNLTIRPGETVALIGPSGGGKSTLIRLLAGVLKPTQGCVLAAGKDLAKMSAHELRYHRAHSRIIEQTHLLVPQLSVHQNVIAGKLPLWPWHKVMASALWPIEKQPVNVLLESLSIGEHQWRPASDLSGGQMQRVAIARALISEPTTLLADEPTASLDPATARAVTEIILNQAKARGVTLVFCTHWLDVVMNRCDRIIGLRDGMLVLDAKPAEVTEEVLHFLYQGSEELHEGRNERI